MGGRGGGEIATHLKDGVAFDGCESSILGRLIPRGDVSKFFEHVTDVRAKL